MSEADYENMSETESIAYFNTHYNISYVPEDTPNPNIQLLFKHYAASSLIYGILLCIWLFNPYFAAFFDNSNIDIRYGTYVYLGYLLLAPIFLLIFKPKNVYNSNALAVMEYLLKIIKSINYTNKNVIDFLQWLKPTYKQKQSILLYLIKFFFAPLMLNFMFIHIKECSHTYGSLYNSLKAVFSYDFSTIIKFLVSQKHVIYVFLINILFFIDCFFFSLGYCTELTILKNKIKSVESTFLGIFVCIICYNPFNTVFATLIPWWHDDMNLTISPNMPIISAIMYILAFLSTIIYASASTVLFTKASNLTNRGTVTIFPYNIIRHPAYASKLFLWYLASLPVINLIFKAGGIFNVILYLITAAIWTFIYYLRAVTEERHLSLDPEYRKYMKKVKYRFIPYIL